MAKNCRVSGKVEIGKKTPENIDSTKGIGHPSHSAEGPSLKTTAEIKIPMAIPNIKRMEI